MEFVESCLRHKSEMVIYEAAHAIVNMKKTSARELAPAVSVLQLFCSSSKPTLRFAAVRTLNKVAMTHPAAVTACNLDLESLITDANRSVATLAITTLLKTGAESSVDRLMKQVLKISLIYFQSCVDILKMVTKILNMYFRYPVLSARSATSLKLWWSRLSGRCA
jgi:Adaptin N terminal region